MAMSNPLSFDFLSQKPARAAAILQTLADQQAADYLARIPTRILVPVIDRMERWPAARILECMPVEQNAAIVSQLDYQSAAALLRLQSIARRDQLLDNLPKPLVRALRRSLAYAGNTVGAWADSAAPHFSATTSAGECLALLKKMPKAAGTTLVITDHLHNVVGLVSIDKLLIGPDKMTLGDMADRNVQPLDAQMSLTVARDAHDWYRYSSLPVRASQGVYVGAISRESLQRALRLSQPTEPMTGDNSLTAHLSRAMLAAVSGMLALLSFEALAMLTRGDTDDAER